MSAPQYSNQGFSQGCLRGGSKSGGGPPQGEKKIQSFKFWCSQWPILTKMAVKYGIYFYFSCPQGGFPPCGAEWGGSEPPSPPPPGENPGSSSKYTTYAHGNQKIEHSLRPHLSFFKSTRGSLEKNNCDRFHP